VVQQSHPELLILPSLPNKLQPILNNNNKYQLLFFSGVGVITLQVIDFREEEKNRFESKEKDEVANLELNIWLSFLTIIQRIKKDINKYLQ